jgi:hypothetical protein
MRLEELKQRWLEGEAKDFTVVTDEPIEALFQNRAMLGDFTREYVKHLLLPLWHRIWWLPEWCLVERRMREVLNQKELFWVEKERKASAGSDVCAE